MHCLVSTAPTLADRSISSYQEPSPELDPRVHIPRILSKPLHHLHRPPGASPYPRWSVFTPSSRTHPTDLPIFQDHCIEMLRQKLTCDADVGIVTHTWVARRETPWPNFNTLHKCRNYAGVVQWSEKHQAPGIGNMMRRPSDIAGLEPPP